MPILRRGDHDVAGAAEHRERLLALGRRRGQMGQGHGQVRRLVELRLSPPLPDRAAFGTGSMDA